MIRWEYNHVTVEGGIAEAIPALDRAGLDGWDVVAMSESNYFGTTTYLIKRPLLADVVATEEPVKHTHSIDSWCSSRCPHYGTTNQIV
jgi:hypothetical protein